jgi:hypothetical protein
MRIIVPAIVALSFLAAGTASADRDGRKWWKPRDRERQIPAIPEPSGALLFGAGLLAAAAATRRRPTR